MAGDQNPNESVDEGDVIVASDFVLYDVITDGLAKRSSQELDTIGRALGQSRIATGSFFVQGDFWYRARLRTVILSRIRGAP